MIYICKHCERDVIYREEGQIFLCLTMPGHNSERYEFCSLSCLQSECF
jgi:hypothetical protein